MNNTKKFLTLPLFIYDDECTLCVRFKDSLERVQKENRFLMVPLSHKKVFTQFPLLNIEDCDTELHLIDLGGKIHRGPEAIKIILTTYPAASKFTWLMDSKMGSKAIDYFYKMSTKYRQTLLNKCKTCR